MRCQNTSVPRVGTVQPYSVEAARRQRRRPCMAYPPVTSALLLPSHSFDYFPTTTVNASDCETVTFTHTIVVFVAFPPSPVAAS